MSPVCSESLTDSGSAILVLSSLLACIRSRFLKTECFCYKWARLIPTCGNKYAGYINGGRKDRNKVRKKNSSAL
jgi:hypothetical protein